jgi:hypothetical protein
MTKTILIPIDLRIASLNTLKVVLEKNQEDAPDVLLMYAEYLGDSITELLFYSPEKFLQVRMSQTFEEALEILKNRFENRVNSISLKPFHGRNASAMRQFMRANSVSDVFVPLTYRLQTRGRAFDPIPLLKKTGMPVTEIEWLPGPDNTEQGQLISLFN